MRLRFVLWLVAFGTLVFPPAMMPRHAVAAHGPAAHGPAAHTPAEAGVMPDCHKPPPPCPDEGTAKHAAATCCPLMGGAVAVMPAEQSNGGRVELVGVTPVRTAPLSGRTYSKDPPPPRM